MRRKLLLNKRCPPPPSPVSRQCCTGRTHTHQTNRQNRRAQSQLEAQFKMLRDARMEWGRGEIERFDTDGMEKSDSL